MHPDSDCDGQDMVEKIKILSNQTNWSHLKIHQKSMEIIETNLFWCCDIVCSAVGLCIASKPIRGKTWGHTRPNTIFIKHQLPH
jgi:hypothetical protein